MEVQRKKMSAEDILESFEDGRAVRIVFRESTGDERSSDVIDVFVVDPPSRNWFLAIKTALLDFDIVLGASRLFDCEVA